jgi:osmoprotectant transport system substrate-binding protein
MTIGVVVLLVVAACSDDKKTTSTASSSGGNKPTITIGAQDFGESAILAEIYKQGLEAKGFTVKLQKLGGFRDIEIQAFDGDTINFAPEYAASMLEFLNGKKGEASSDVALTVNKLLDQLKKKDLAAFKVTGAVDTNAFVMKKAKADQLGIKTLSDLAAKGTGLKIGAPADCETNPFCLPGLKTKYGLDLSSGFQALETSAIVPALEADTIDIALLFSTDGRIAANNYVLLQDDKQLLAADNVIPVVKDPLAKNTELESAVNAIGNYITTDKLIALNKRYDVDKEDAAVIAKDFLTDAGLI